MTFAATRLQLDDIEATTETRTGQPHFSQTQHGQFGPTPQAHPANADQCDCQPTMPGSPSDDANLKDTIRQIREHQRSDLAMLRLAFRQFIEPKNPDNQNENTNPTLRDISSSELNQIVSAVVRMHDDERQLLGIKTPDPQTDTDHEYNHLEKLSTRQLLELCYQEGIAPPSTIQTQTQTENPSGNGQT